MVSMGSKGWCSALAVALLGAANAHAQVQITEFMYDGINGEWVEFTNRGASPVDMTDWVFDDDGATVGSVNVGAFGMVAAGESVVVAQSADAATFRAAWGLPVTVKVVAYTGGQLQRNDQINLRDSLNNLVARLNYGDQSFPGTIRTQNKGGWPCSEVLGNQTITAPPDWRLAVVADAQGSVTSVGADIGSPGTFVRIFCGPPPTGACCLSGNCTIETEADCDIDGGQYQGDNTICDVGTCPAPNTGEIRISEYMYSGLGLEFVEFTNVGPNPVDMTDWSYDDDTNTPGSQDLSAFGVVAPGQSVILAEATDAAFIADWNLAGVVVIGGNTNNLSRNDQINLYDSLGVLVDRLNYGDQTFPGTIRAQNFSGWPCEDAIGANTIVDWFLSKIPDVQNSYMSAAGDVGNPGTFLIQACAFCGNGRLDAGEQCDGGVCCTPNCTFADSSVVCRGAAGTCDVAESCSGGAANCPADVLVLAGIECRPSAGDCDPAESCDGQSFACPPDALDAPGTECRASAGECDPAEACDGQSAACPPDVLDPQGTECRPTAGDCDVAESCDGQGVDCPFDTLVSAGTECRAALGDCDVVEVCDGQGVICPPDSVDPAGTECRASVGDCDMAEVCDGTGRDCPADGVLPSSTECRASLGVCDPAENCDGQGVDCPADVLSTAVCRASNGPCDPAESCDGVDADCPADVTITSCLPGDGCCATGCNANNDSDCPAVCGNGVVELGEECDDSNTSDGDGCSATCASEAPDVIPAASEWGLFVLALTLAAAAKVHFGRRRMLA